MIDELKAFEDAKLLRSVAIQLLPTEAAYKTFRVKLHPDRFQPDNAMDRCLSEDRTTVATRAVACRDTAGEE